MNIKKGVEKLDELQKSKRLTEGVDVSFDSLKEILLAMDEPEQPSPSVECTHAYVGYPICPQCKPVQPSATQESVTVEDREIQHWLLNNGYGNVVVSGNDKPYFYVSDVIMAYVRSNAKDMVMIPRDVAQDVIDKGYELPNELYDAIKQSLKGQA